jgi:hypothetical protein
MGEEAWVGWDSRRGRALAAAARVVVRRRLRRVMEVMGVREEGNDFSVCSYQFSALSKDEG